jgi:VCBS repeat-containing protein
VLTGSVLPNDTQGADRIPSGPITPGTYTGTYGTLVLQANGDYTYTLNSSDPDFIALHGGGTASETFTYTLNDADGDTSTATLTLNILNEDDGVTLAGLGSSGGDQVVYEANLPAGSAADNEALTRQGTFTVEAKDGLATLTINGIAVISDGALVGAQVAIVGTLGNTLTITGFDPATGVVSYHYTLGDAESHGAGGGANDLSENFQVVATDTDGDDASASLNIRIVDDTPRAIDDGNAQVATENNLTLTGNVLTNDTQGADRTGTPIVAGTYTGNYGTLVLQANGDYTYTLNSSDPDFVALHGGGIGQEQFTYTLQDADGDTSQATLILDINNIDDPVLIDVGDGQLQVHEKFLDNGSDPYAPGTLVGGQLQVTAADGLHNLSFGGITVIKDGQLVDFASANLSIETPLHNTLTVIGYDAASGTLYYTYQLQASEQHPNGQGANGLQESFSVVASDTDGTTSNAQVTVTIVDDTPQAVDDSNAITASENQLTLTGNVLANDTQGADRTGTPIVAGTYTGTYGTLVLQANGDYTYTLNSADPDFIALHGGGLGQEQFTYTLQDADGDTSQATLTLNIENLNDLVSLGGLDVQGGEQVVFEANLANGSQPDAAQLTRTATFSVDAKDGLATLTINDVSVVSNGVLSTNPVTIIGALGNTLTITDYNAVTGVLTYSYVLSATEAHASGAGNNSISESFTVVATDTDGDSASGSLDIRIVDDTPQAVDDSNAITATENQLTLTGNVLANDTQGADRTGTPIVAGTYTGTYGTLVLQANGDYTYTLNSADPDFIALHGGGLGQEQFTYTLQDADGDTSQATLTLNIENLNDLVSLGGLDVQGGEQMVFEANLASGSQPDAAQLTRTGTFSVDAKDGLATLTINDVSVVSNGALSANPVTIIGALGNTLTITDYNAVTGVLTYSYVLSASEAHASGGGNNAISESFTVVATDTDGDSANGSLDIRIVDDTPQAVDDSNAITASENQLTLTGNVLTNDTQGADRTGTPIVAGTYTGTYGTLVLQANGDYTYTLNSSDPDFIALHGGGLGQEQFTYTLQDADGDTSQATLTLDVKNINDPVTIDIDCGQLSIHEKYLADGSSPYAPGTYVNGSLKVTAADGLHNLSIGGITVMKDGQLVDFASANLSVETPLHNTLTVIGYDAASGTLYYTYHLLDNEAHTGSDNLAESFQVVASDADGSTTSAQVTVNIVDDAPIARDDLNHHRADEQHSVLTGNVLANDTQGADRTATPIVAGTYTGTYGTLVLQANGDYTYTLDSSDPDFIALHGGGLGQEQFTYTLQDADGDTSQATLTLNVKNIDDPVTIDIDCGALNIYEKHLAAGTEPYGPGTYVNGTLKVTAPDGLQSLSIAGIKVIENGHLVDFSTANLSTQTQLHNVLTVTGYDAASGTLFYTYHLLGAEQHANGDNANSLSETFTVRATDSDHSTATASVTVNIIDDMPDAGAPLQASIVAGQPGDCAPGEVANLAGSLLANGTFGADGGFVQIVIVDGTYYSFDPKTQGDDPVLTVTTALGGALTVDMQTGAYTYTPPALATGCSAQECIEFVLSDNDGDQGASSLVIDVQGNTAPVAGADHVITNILSANIVVPASLLLANDSDANRDQLSVANNRFTTGWADRSSEFCDGPVKTVDFSARNERFATIARGEFSSIAGSLTAAVLVCGFLGALSQASANDEDVISVSLKKGETLNLDHNLASGQIGLEWKLAGTDWQPIGDGNSFTASQAGTYQIHVSNLNAHAVQNYELALTIDTAADVHTQYVLSDNHGGTDTGALTLSYQGGHALVGTAADESLLAGNGNDTLHAGAGNDVLDGGLGKNLIDGGDGVDTVSYQSAKAGVTVDLSQAGYQDTKGAGLDKLVSIENLIGSNYDDKLIGDAHDNIIQGGAGNDRLGGGLGNDTLIGGAGDDILTGGANHGEGNNTFVWQKGDFGHDLVTDFHALDKLDLSQLLQGEQASADSLESFLQFKVVGNGSNLISTIEVSSVANGPATTTIDLLHYDLAGRYGVNTGDTGLVASGHDTASIINGMLGDHTLKVDTV